MDEEVADPVKLPSGLTAALRVARLEQAERALAQADLQDAELGRLELLREMLAPMLAEVPPGVDLFDVGVVPGAHPRLFVDMIAFVEMGRDKRTYRFLQDRRSGRLMLAESERPSAMVEAVTAYVARRLVEREALLASIESPPVRAASSARPPQPLPVARRSPGLAALRVARVLVDGLGVATLGGLIWLGIHFAHGRLPGW